MPYNDLLILKIIVNCSSLEDNCIGGFETGDFLCYEGHIGAMCKECDVSTFLY